MYLTVYIYIYIYIHTNLSCVTFQGNSEIWSDKTGGRFIQAYLI
jgi:hypothetical protein